MLRIAGELASGTILWMADERAIGEHVVPRITKAAAGGGTTGAADRRRRPRRAVLATTRSTARATWANQAARARRVLAELPAPARARGRHRRRRPPRGGRRVGRRRSAAQLPRRGRHRPRGPRSPARRRPRRAHRVAPPDRGVPRLALSRALSVLAGGGPCNCITSRCSSATPTGACGSTGTVSASRFSSTGSSTATGRRCSESSPSDFAR